MMTSRVLLGALGALLVGCAASLPAPDGALSAAGLPRLYCVEKKDEHCIVYRSSQPTEKQFEVLARGYGLKSVLKLNLRVEGRDRLPPGVELIHHPWLPAGPVSEDEAKRTLDDLDAAPKPVLIHCTHGEDRTGLVVALWRVRHDTPVFSARGEMLAYGFHPSLFWLDEAWERATKGKR